MVYNVRRTKQVGQMIANPTTQRGGATGGSPHPASQAASP